MRLLNGARRKRLDSNININNSNSNSITDIDIDIDLPWGVTIPRELAGGAKVHLASPPLVEIAGFLTAAQCRALVGLQRNAGRNNNNNNDQDGGERVNYLNYDVGAGNGYRQGVDVASDAFAPVRARISQLLNINSNTNTELVFREELWVRPRKHTVVVRDVTTVRYYVGEGVPPHVDGKDLTVLVYLEAPRAGGETVFDNIKMGFVPVVGNALVYESKHSLTHHAQPVRDGEKWVLQLLIDYRVRSDDAHF